MGLSWVPQARLRWESFWWDLVGSLRQDLVEYSLRDSVKPLRRDLVQSSWQYLVKSLRRDLVESCWRDLVESSWWDLIESFWRGLVKYLRRDLVESSWWDLERSSQPHCSWLAMIFVWKFNYFITLYNGKDLHVEVQKLNYLVGREKSSSGSPTI